MKMRPWGEDGDMIPVQNASQMWKDTDAVEGAVNSRLVFNHGDWWEDEELGFEVPRFLLAGLRGSNQTTAMLINYIVAYIRQTEGVRDIESFGYSFENRTLTMDIGINTIYGEDLGRSVNISELLSTLS